MARDLNRLKEELWTHFEAAVEKQARYEDSRSSGSSTPSNFGIAGRNSIANLANAIVNVERELREREEKAEEADKLSLPGKKFSRGA